MTENEVKLPAHDADLDERVKKMNEEIRPLLGKYAHVPVATNAAGEKLSKRTLAQAIDAEDSAYLLFLALQFLGQNPPEYLQSETNQIVWQWAIANWQLHNVPAVKSKATSL